MKRLLIEQNMGTAMDFREKLFHGLVEHVTVYVDDSVRFQLFRNGVKVGTEI